MKRTEFAGSEPGPTCSQSTAVNRGKPGIAIVQAKGGELRLHPLAAPAAAVEIDVKPPVRGRYLSRHEKKDCARIAKTGLPGRCVQVHIAKARTGPMIVYRLPAFAQQSSE